MKLKHARVLTKSEADQSSVITNYIPHHGVTHPNKPGRIRVVFDAAARYQGTSLNMHQFKKSSSWSRSTGQCGFSTSSFSNW